MIGWGESDPRGEGSDRGALAQPCGSHSADVLFAPRKALVPFWKLISITRHAVCRRYVHRAGEVCRGTVAPASRSRAQITPAS